MTARELIEQLLKKNPGGSMEVRILCGMNHQGNPSPIRSIVVMAEIGNMTPFIVLEHEA